MLKIRENGGKWVLVDKTDIKWLTIWMDETADTCGKWTAEVDSETGDVRSKFLTDGDTQMEQSEHALALGTFTQQSIWDDLVAAEVCDEIVADEMLMDSDFFAEWVALKAQEQGYETKKIYDWELTREITPETPKKLADVLKADIAAWYAE